MQTFLLIMAVSIDVFFAFVSCGIERIKIGTWAALSISGICSGVLFAALLAGNVLEGLVQPRAAVFLSFLGLFLMGIYKLAEYGVRKYIRKNKFICKRVKFSFSQLNVILSIYNNPVMADRDHSATMSLAESVFLALAMSFDGFFGGFGAGLLGVKLWAATAGSFVVGFLAVKIGCYAGTQASKRYETDVSWLSGILFLALAFSKFL